MAIKFSGGRHFLLVGCSKLVSIMHRFQHIRPNTSLAYVTAHGHAVL